MLLLHPGIGLGRDSEITISYGFSKSAAEMLFSYGFIDKGSVTSSLTLNLEPFPDDPLGRAKFAAFLGPPVVCTALEYSEEITRRLGCSCLPLSSTKSGTLRLPLTVPAPQSLG